MLPYQLNCAAAPAPPAFPPRTTELPFSEPPGESFARLLSRDSFAIRFFSELTFSFLSSAFAVFAFDDGLGDAFARTALDLGFGVGLGVGFGVTLGFGVAVGLGVALGN